MAVTPARHRRLQRRLDAEPQVLIRLAAPDESGALGRLAALDSQAPLKGDALIAEVDGVTVAALSLHDAQMIADPFAHTKAIGELLRLRMAAITAPKPPVTPLRRLLRLALTG